MSSLFKYTYYDSPDGKDLLKKMFYTNKKVSIIGFGLATSEIMLVSKPYGYLNTLYRYGQLMGPMYVATSAFCIATYVSTNVRGKDDKLNYVIGGFTAGSLTGIIIKRNLLAFWLGIACATIGFVKKDSKLENYEFYPIKYMGKSLHGDFRTPYRNWTLYDARPKGWIAAEERKE